MSLIAKANLLVNLDQESLLRRITNRIRQSLELEDIITATTAEVRSLLGTDRVMIYKFHVDGSGQVIAESIYEHRLPSLLGLNFPADDIPREARELFLKSKVRCAVNVETGEIGQSGLYNSETGEQISEEIRYRPVDPCHIKYLKAMGVKSSVVAPIIHQDTVWGLLVSHHSEAREISKEELAAMQMVVDQLSVAIAQSELLTQARATAQREAIINHIATLLHSLPTIVLQPALEATVQAFNGVGGRLCLRNQAFDLQNGHQKSLSECLIPGGDCVQLYTCGQQPIITQPTIYPLVEQYSAWQEHYKFHDYRVSAISDIYQTPAWQSLQPAFQGTQIRSVLIIPLEYRQQLLGYLSIFRQDIETETLWAGQHDPDQRQLYPRLSFELWRECKKGQAQAWTNEDIELAQALGKHFAAAIQQYELYQQVQAFNENLEQQVAKRTLELQETAEQQQAVFSVITKIRESLDTETIFKITTEEVCQLIKADRVSVYRFNAEWGGEFVGDFEAVNSHWSYKSKLGVNSVWNDTYLQKTEGGRYRHNQTFTVNDIHHMGFDRCHVNVLESYHIKGFVLAPIFVGQKLWGLLATYQHSTPRQWKTSEVNFITQIAAQLGVALQQAELLNQTQQQTQKLTQALHHLQQTQSQLIQTEKMSSLGQLVAGIAHEINNPVNFIYGNLSHVSEYATDLLRMLELYQQEFSVRNEAIQNLAAKIDLEFLAEDLPKTLGSMQIGVERIRQIVMSLRNFSRLDEAEMKAVNIHEGIDSTLLILQHRLKARSDIPAISIIKEYNDIPLVECYAGQMNQVFMNVLSNAIDALEDYRRSPSENYQHQIIIRTSMGELADNTQSVVIQIIDNGPGIPENFRNRICDPFFTTKPVGKGTGLGLSISYGIVVDKHGGVLECDSQLGVGTEFRIAIPIKQSSQ
ncbi:GAF domain-containing sensor histidine kinase [Nostoc sp. CMAA1605]|uniref:GAF domain-containing sensor histidine kinase n=1 Tax=Nostoc sp. CMAA1605 TaxID=2055159 RepID=UPI001F23A8D9|nr:GAF domain-containing protein [Nostoc sp. CMAA1605]MCF4969763.1 GAF domain-containing protein [Nostoc sp. CMAA1605]